MRLDLSDRLQIMSTRAQHFTASEIFFLHYILDATMFRQNKHNPRGFITCVWINVKTSINTLRYLHHRLLRGKCEMFTSWILISGSRDKNIYVQTRLKFNPTVTSVTFCFKMSQLHLFQPDLNSRLRRWIFWPALLDWHIWTEVPFMICYGFSIFIINVCIICNISAHLPQKMQVNQVSPHFNIY